MKLVVDTSVILKWFVRAENDHEEALWYSFATEDLIVPDLAFAEATAALRRKVLEGEVGEEQALAALRDLPEYFSERVASAYLAESAYELAGLMEHPVYDCFFLAASVIGDGRQLLTADLGFVRKVVGKGFGEYARIIGRSTVSVDTLTQQKPENFRALIERIGEVESLISSRLDGPPIALLTQRVCNIPEFEPETERSWFGRFKDALSQADRDILRKLVAACWYGRPLAAETYKQMHHDAGELTNDPERHAYYIASLIPYFDNGIKRLRAAS